MGGEREREREREKGKTVYDRLAIALLKVVCHGQLYTRLNT